MLEKGRKTNDEKNFACALRPEEENRMKLKSITLLAVFTLALVASACAKAEPSTPDPQFPAFVYDSAQSLKAYRLAVQMPEMLYRLPCYCDCGRASGHKSLHDCFFKSDGSFNDHASACEVCDLEMMDAAQWKSQGKSLKEIRARIDQKYSPYGTATDTAPVPENPQVADP